MIAKNNFDPTVLQAIVRSIPVGVLAISAAGQLEFWNPAAERILGLKGADITGDLASLDLERLLKNGTAVALQVRTMQWRSSAGEELGRILLLTDVTADREADSSIPELAEQRENARAREMEHLRFRQLLEAAPDAIIEVDRDGKIVLLNKVTEELFRYRREELLGQPVEILIPNDLRSGHHKHRDDYRAHPSRRPMGTGLKLEGQRKDGSRFPVEISLSPVQFEDGFGVTAIIRDVTDRHLAEEKLKATQSAYTAELAAKNRELELRNEEVERASHLKSEFLSGMSHELRTPLHTMIGFTELLEEQIEGPLNEKQQRFIRHIHADSQHLLALINDVLDLSKIESGRLELHLEVFSLREAIEETVSSIGPQGNAKSIEIEIDVPPAIEINADRLRVKQILYNLLSNAVKFTPKGGRVWVTACVRESFAEVCVRDTGIGIPVSEQESVFDKFYQVGQRQAGGLEGTGLGLAITRHLVEQHGGSVRLESELGKGTQFTFTIPLPATTSVNRAV